MNARTRAKKGGEMVAGVFYKGGQFLPASEPQRGKWNRKSNSSKRVRKVEVAPYTWVPQVDGKSSIFARLGGTVATMNGDEMVFCGNAKTLAYVGLTKSRAKELVESFNNGERWFTA